MTVATALETDERAYRDHERIVLAMLATRYRDIDPDGRRELYHEAWASVLKRRRNGVEVSNLRGYLLGAADKLASKRVYGADSRRRQTYDPTGPYFRSLPDLAEPPDEAVLAADEARRVRMLVDELGESEQSILKLRIEQGLEPSEIREHLGLTDRQYRRGAERATKALLEQFRAFDTGEWAKGKRSLLCACVMGIASERQRERAERLVSDDPCCRAMLSELRQMGEKVAAATPVPALLVSHDAPVRFTDRMIDLIGAALSRFKGGDALSGARRHASEAAGAAKQHVATAYARAADPTPMLGVRPGASMAVIVSCVAAGSGAYCAVGGLPERVKPAFGIERSQARAADRPKRLQERAVVPAQPVTRPQTVPTVTDLNPAPSPTPTVTPPPTTPAAPPPPVPETEFEPTASQAGSAPVASPEAAPSTSGTSSSSGRSSAPKKAAGGSGEFAP